MLFYFIFPLVLLFLSVIGIKSKRMGFFIFILLLFFSMFRGDKVGTDTIHYIDAASSSYQALQYIGDAVVGSPNFELVYFAVTYIIYSNDLNPRLIIYFFSFVTIFFLFLSAKRFKVSFSLLALFYVFLGYYFLSFNIARQLAAMSVAVYGLSFLKEETNKRFLFFVWVIIASLIHNVVIVVSLVYFLKYVHIESKKAATIVGLLYVISMLIPFTPIFMSILGMTNISYASGYGAGGNYDVETRSLIGILYNLLNGILMLLLFCKTTKGRKTDVYDNIFLSSLVVFSLLYYGNLGTYRFTLLFSIFQCIYLAAVFMSGIRKDSVYFTLIICFNYYLLSGFIDGAYYLQL